jgi:hypothetical protein
MEYSYCMEYGGGVSVGGFSPVVNYTYGGLSSPSIAAYSSPYNPYSPTGSFSSFGYGGGLTGGGPSGLTGGGTSRPGRINKMEIPAFEPALFVRAF